MMFTIDGVLRTVPPFVILLPTRSAHLEIFGFLKEFSS